jgi:16S rRNA (uracil1498-N3)-methyltransferase
MDARLRTSAAHVLVEDLDVPTADDAVAHHLRRVLRLREGEPVTATDGRGRWRACRVRAGALEPDGPVESVAAPSSPLTVAAAVPKGDRAERLVRQCTEVGVDRIVLLTAERSVVRWDDERAARHGERLRRVAAEAAMQSRRVWLPELAGPVAALSVLPAAAVAEPGGHPLGPADTTVAIGPEGGWSEDELAVAAARVGLGPNVLRVETAAVVAAALLVALRAGHEAIR